MGLFNRNNKNQRAAKHRDAVAPWEKYARQDDRIMGDICLRDHQHDCDSWECDG